MSPEQPPQQPPQTSEITQEKAIEKLPSQEEIQSEIERLCAGRERKVLRVLSDENGALVYEIETTNEKGEKIEYNFQRAEYDYKDPTAPTKGRFFASIHVTFFGSAGMPCGGECVANYLDGVWHPTG